MAGKLKNKVIAEKPDDFGSKFNAYMDTITPTSKINVHDVAEMRRRFANYRNATEAYQMEYGNQTCYYALGLSEYQVRMFTGAKYNENPERGEFLRNMKFYLAAYREQSIAKGYMNPMSGMFWQKNYDGLQDVTEVQVTQTDVDFRDVKSIEARYRDVVDVEFKRRKQIATSKAQNDNEQGE